MPEADAKLQGSPTVHRAARPAAATRSSRRCSASTTSRANNLVPVLRPMIAPNNTITAYPANNTLVIHRLRRQPAPPGPHHRGRGRAGAPARWDRFRSRTPIASDAAVALQQNAADPGLPAAPRRRGGRRRRLRTTVVAEPRTQLADDPRLQPRARVQQARQLIEKLDQPYAARAGNIWVVPLKNADAVKLAADAARQSSRPDASFHQSASPAPGGRGAPACGRWYRQRADVRDPAQGASITGGSRRWLGEL